MVDSSQEEVQEEILDENEKPAKPLATKGIMGFYNKHFNKTGFQLTKNERNWTLYDCGNSAVFMFFVLVGVSIGDLAHNVPFFGENPTTTMSIFNSVSGLIIAILGPVLGAIADNRGRKKSLFKFFIIMGLFGCYGALFANISSFFASDIAFFVIFLIFAMLILIGLGGSLLFYDSMLADVTTPARSDRVSSSGYAVGYVGSLVPFIVCLLIYYFFMDPAYSVETYGVSEDTAYALLRLAISVCIVLSGTWWLIWSRPLLKTYKQITGVDPVPHQIKDAFIKLGKTFKELKKYKAPFLFLFAFFFYVNGVNTVIALSATYAKDVLTITQPSLETSDLNIFLIVALIMTQIVAASMSIVFGKLANKTGARPLIIVCVLGYLGFVTYGVFMRTIFDFFVLAFGVGVFLGGIQALSRSYYSKLAPIEKQTEFFGLYDIFNKSSNFLGSFIYAGITTALIGVPGGVKLYLTDEFYLSHPQIGVACLAVFFLVGFILLLCIPHNSADKDKKIKSSTDDDTAEVAQINE
ncbi:MAG: MFS transporter [Christensenellaceae bacterium]|jgi:UMF1 family MFS transporter|nr:MFS transporter [Christensenellaceae bacterium]